jgi:hypothetical protein
MPFSIQNLQDRQLLDLQQDLAGLTVVELAAFLNAAKGKGVQLVPVLALGQVALAAAPPVLLARRDPAFDANLGAAAAWKSGVGIFGSGFATGGARPDDVAHFSAIVGWVTSDRETQLDLMVNDTAQLPSGAGWTVPDINAAPPNANMSDLIKNLAPRTLGVGGGQMAFRYDRIAPFMQIKVTNIGAAGNPAKAWVYGVTV